MVSQPPPQLPFHICHSSSRALPFVHEVIEPSGYLHDRTAAPALPLVLTDFTAVLFPFRQDLPGCAHTAPSQRADPGQFFPYSLGEGCVREARSFAVYVTSSIALALFWGLSHI